MFKYFSRYCFYNIRGSGDISLIILSLLYEHLYVKYLNFKPLWKIFGLQIVNCFVAILFYFCFFPRATLLRIWIHALYGSTPTYSTARENGFLPVMLYYIIYCRCGLQTIHVKRAGERHHAIRIRTRYKNCHRSCVLLLFLTEQKSFFSAKKGREKLRNGFFFSRLSVSKPPLSLLVLLLLLLLFVLVVEVENPSPRGEELQQQSLYLPSTSSLLSLHQTA